MAELEQEEMSFWDHLEALRWTLFRSFLALFIFAIGSFAFMRGSDGIFDRVVLAPCYSDFIFYRWLCDLNQWLVRGLMFCLISVMIIFMWMCLISDWHLSSLLT